MMVRMRHLKNMVATVLRMLGVAVVIALIMLLLEVLAGIFLFEMETLFG